MSSGSPKGRDVGDPVVRGNRGGSWFRSAQERWLWTCALCVQLGIWATLPLAGRLVGWLEGWYPLELVFFVAFVALMSAVAWAALRSPRRTPRDWLVAALVAVSALLVTRTGIPLVERSHLIEYGLLAVLIFHALDARRAAGGAVRWVALPAIGGTALLGLVDEAIQAVLPGRVFDPRDLLFNGLAAVSTVGMTVLLRAIRPEGPAPP